MKPLCKVSGCEKVVHAKWSGYCCQHHYKFKRYGDPLAGVTHHNRGTGRDAQGYAYRGSKKEHIVLAEKALGGPLPLGAEVHHVNGVKDDNRPGNLVICQDHYYHRLLHTRQEALDACGNPEWRKCPYCKQYDSLENMFTPARKSGSAKIPKPYHRHCRSEYDRARGTAWWKERNRKAACKSGSSER